MFTKFDVFFMIRFLNSFDKTSKFPPVEIEFAAKELLDYYGFKNNKNLYDDIFALDISCDNS